MADRMMRKGFEANIGPGGADGELLMPPPPIGIDSPGKLSEWIAAIPRRQAESQAVAELDGQTLREHKEIYLLRPFRIADSEGRNAAWRSATESLAWEIFGAVSRAPGAVYWRIAPEFAVCVRPIWIRIGDDGPDRDFITDCCGWADHSYGLVRAYTRLSVHFTA